MVAAVELVEIGDHCMFANGCFVTDAATASTTRSSRSPGRASPRKGPTRIGDNVWCGANVVVTSGVTIGERCVIGANSVVTQRPPAALDRRGRRPAQVLREIEYPLAVSSSRSGGTAAVAT